MTLKDDSDQRKVFLRLSAREQIGMLWDMLAYVRSKQADNLNDHDRFEREINYIKREMSGISRRRENTLTTSQKIDVELNKRSIMWLWYRDKILANTLSLIQATVVLGILYLVFGGKLP